MKTNIIRLRKIFFFLLIISSTVIRAQTPQGFSYQAVVRNAQGNIVQNQNVSFKFSIIENSATGNIVYIETQQATTNNLGLVVLSIGNGTALQGIFSDIQWGNAAHFLKVELDIAGGSIFVDMGTTQLLSVPYAMHAQTAENAQVYNAGSGLTLSNNTFSHDNHSGDISGSTTLTVTGIQGAPISSTPPVSNQVLQFDGSNWSPVQPSNLINAGNGLNYSGNTLNTLWSQTGNDIYNNNSGRVGIGLNTPSGKVTIQGDTSNVLFEVRDRNGIPVFVVYQDSIQAFVSNLGAKTNKGSFAINAKSQTKAGVHNVFRVVPDSIVEIRDRNGLPVFKAFEDSVHIFISNNSTGTKTNKGSFAVNAKTQSKTPVQPYLDVNVDTMQIIDPSKNRILWYPAKSAFLSGRVLIESPDSVGTNSVSIGFETKAKGNWSQAMGYQSYARGNYSMAIGKNSAANFDNSYAFGENVHAKAFDSYAFGSNAIAEGVGSYAFGSAGRDTLGNLLSNYTKATGIGSYSFGGGCVASGTNSFAFGMNDSAIGVNSVSMGAYSKAYGSYSFAFGFPSFGGYPATTTITSANNGCIAIGTATQASGTGSIAMGRYSFASGTNSISIGYGIPGTFLSSPNYNSASGNLSLAVGYGNAASGTGAYAIGYDNYSAGDYAFSFGTGLFAPTYGQMSLGRYNASIPGTADSWVATDPVFVVGNGQTSGTRSNALTILKNGNIGIGVTAPDNKLDVVGTFQLGNGTSFSKLQAGTYTVGSNASTGVKVVTLTFPSAFTTVPKIVITPRNENGINDIVVISTRNITTTNAVILIYRVDAAGGTWGQNLQFDWFAWE